MINDSFEFSSDDESDSNPHEMDGNNSDVECGLSDLNGMSLNSYHSNGPNTFAQLQQGDLDRQRLLGDRQRNGVYESVIEDGLEGLEHQERYERLLRRAQVEDLNEVSGIGCLYQSGVDRLGRPVIVFCGKWFPAQDIDLEKALLYLIKLLDPIVKSDYVIAYFHTLTSTNNYPSLHWLREVYSVLPYKYKKNLKAFYIVHPTFWTKMMTWWFTTFMAPAIKAKVHSLPGVEHLYSAISKDQLEIPAYITEYDMATNGLHYFTPVQTPT
ncbi:protein GDAP2 homolog isoform X2 [Eupeodes corollae]|uniref:protein GDAP2 homolog isoform X2 n=1 Tax=Eupeodes corollae TaxID=290404 RepID=UPI0024938A8B|nr:protein GDAP2 homolog isoform X2 [Eupeodes corollae]